MATVTCTSETTYEFDVNTFVEEFDAEFKDWLSRYQHDSEEGYAESDVAKKDFVESQIYELTDDDFHYMSPDIFKLKYDDFSMDLRGVWS